MMANSRARILKRHSLHSIHWVVVWINIKERLLMCSLVSVPTPVSSKYIVYGWEEQRIDYRAEKQFNHFNAIFVCLPTHAACTTPLYVRKCFKSTALSVRICSNCA